MTSERATPTLHLLHPLELTLWHPSTRHDPILMDHTFAPDFHEFGRSGRRHTRAEVLDPACAMIQRRRHSQNLCYPVTSRPTKSTARRERE